MKSSKLDFFEPRIEQPALMRREIFVDGQIGGAAHASYGELTLINCDGGLDYLADYAFDGWLVDIRYGDESTAFHGMTRVLAATQQQPVFELNRVSIRLRDSMAALDKPLQANVYAGNNVLPDGLEGGADLKDVPKPKLYGRVANVSPVLVNSSRLIYQVNDGPVAEVVNVFDKGAYLGRGADYANQADMETTAPVPGTFRVWKSGGYFRLGSSPAGQITCAAWESSAIEQCTAAQIAYRLATGSGWINTYNTVADDRTLLDSQNAGSLGLWVTAGMTVAEALDQVSSSVGAWWGFDRLNKFRMARFDAPSGTPVATLTEVEILSIERESFSLNGSAAPAWRVVVNHDVNHTVQDAGSLAGAVSADRRHWLAQASRQAKAENAAIKTRHPLAQEVVYDTLLTGAGYAQPEAERRLALLSADRIVLNLTVQVDAALLSAIDLGVVVTVQYPRFGLDAGKLFRVTAIQTDYQRNQIELKVWG